MKNILNRKEFKNIMESAQAPVPAQAAPAQPPAQAAPAQPPATQPVAQPTTDQPTTETEVKSGDLSNYDNQQVTKYPDTVKKLVDLIKDLDKQQMIELRNFVAQQKGLADPKTDIGLL